MVIPFLGGTVTNWAVDMTCLCTAVVYMYLSICAFQTTPRNCRFGRTCGLAGTVLALAVFLVLIIPDVLSSGQLAPGDYLVLMLWSLAGMLYYHGALVRDRENRLGKSMIMWLMMFFFLFFATTMWTRVQSEKDILSLSGKDGVSAVLTTGSLVTMIVVVISLIVLFDLFSMMLGRERELDKKIIQAEERNRAKTTFLSSMSHDIRTPMNAIMGFTSLALRSVDDSEKTEDYLQKIYVSGGHLLSLINDVLEMSRIESGKIELNPEPLDIPQTLADLETIIRGQAEAKRQTLLIGVDGVTDPTVLCDKLRLNQVLMNLASNAIKYTPEGGTISIRAVQTAPVSDGLAPYELRVRDNGIGMSPEFAGRIFEAFEREKTSTVSGIQGTGLGMAITKRIVDCMGGSIAVQTAPGEGSEFIVSLVLPVAESVQRETAESGQETDFTGRRILLVDDIEFNRELAGDILEMMGFEVDMAADGCEAVERVRDAAQEPTTWS